VNTNSGVEQKRGRLAQSCAEEAGLEFKRTEDTPMDQMPDFYASIDALIMPSLQEGAGLPALEAAAAGRLVIGTPVGHFPFGSPLHCSKWSGPSTTSPPDLRLWRAPL